MKSKDVFPAVFSRYARAYHEHQAELPLARRRVLELVGAEPGERAVDLGCGPGSLTLPLAEAVGPEGKVLAIDLADGMLEIVREAAPAWVETQRMDIEQLHLPSRAFDVVVSGHAYQFVPDLPHALSEAHRLLGAGGRFAASVPIGGGRGARDLVEDVMRQLPEVAEPDDRAATYETLTDDARLAAAMTAAGFTAVAVERCREEVSYFDVETLVRRTTGWWGLAWRLEQLDGERRARFLDDLRGAWTERITDWPYVAVNVNTVLSGRA